VPKSHFSTIERTT